MFFLYPRRRSLRQLAFLPAAALALSAPGLLHGQVTYTGTSPALSFGSVNYCPAGQSAPAPCSSTLTLTYSVAANTTIGSVGILTTGATNLDFQAKANDASSTLCAARTYAAPTTCTVDVTFAPLAPGLRKGAVQIVDGGGNILANTYIYGSGVAPVIAFPAFTTTPAAAISVGNGVGGIAIDAGGNLYFTDPPDVKEILAVDGSIPANPTIVTVAPGVLPSPSEFTGIAVLAIDGAGNLFVNAGLNQHSSALTLQEIVAVNGSIPANPTVKTLFSGTYVTQPFAVDGSGNLYFTQNDGFGRSIVEVNEILAVNGSIPANPTVKTLGGGFYEPIGVAVDAAGDVFVDDDYSTKEIVAVNGSIPANPTINTVYYDGGPFMALDAAGDVYFGDRTNAVEELPAINGNYTSGAFPLATPAVPQQIAIDPKGNVFVLNGLSPSVIDEYTLTAPPTVAFATTEVGQTSTDSPRSVAVQNIGNGRLTGSSELSDTVDFKLASIENHCPSEISLSRGSVCYQGVDFQPQSVAQFNATVTYTDNSLNAASAMQTISLSGAGASLSPIAQVSDDVLQFYSVMYGASYYIPLTVTNIGGGTLTVATSISGPSYFIRSSTCGAGLTAGQSCILQVEFQPVAIGYHADTLTIVTNGTANGSQPANPVVSLTGQGTGVGVEMETPLEFGTIAFGTTEVLPLTIKNIGVSGAVTIGTSINGPSYKVLTTAQNTCLAGVTAGHTCVLPIEFDPVAVGTHDDILTLTPNLGAAASTVHLDGTAD